MIKLDVLKYKKIAFLFSILFIVAGVIAFIVCGGFNKGIDFGSGYSSLATLNVIHFDTLKLDKTLVDYIGNYGGERLLEHTISLSKELGMQVTAEGVEKEEQVQFLTKLSCDSIQGFYFARPQPAEEFVQNLEIG